MILLGIFGNHTHDFHTSLSEINYNSKTKSLEVSIRLFSDDFEKTLNKQNNVKNIKLEDPDKTLEPLIEKYLRKNLSLISANKEVKLLNYIGKETEGEATWIYVEFYDCQNIKNYTLFNNIMQEMFTDQTNLVNIQYLTQKSTIVFDAKTKIAPFPF